MIGHKGPVCGCETVVIGGLSSDKHRSLIDSYFGSVSWCKVVVMGGLSLDKSKSLIDGHLGPV